MGFKFKYDYETVKQYVKENSNCELLETEYVNVKHKMRFKCGECGQEYLSDFDHFKRAENKMCVTCAKSLVVKKRHDNNRPHINELKKYVLDNTECELLEKEYLGTTKKMLFKCACGNEFRTSWNEFKRCNVRRCFDCSKELKSSRFRHSIEYVKMFVEENSTSKLITTEYINSDQILEFECECGKKFYTSFDSFKFSYKRFCNSCSTQSSYEKYVETILIKLKLNYKTQQRFPDCVNKKMLPFDFYLVDYNILIEVDGEGHYRPMKSYESFKHTQKTDKIKDKYCLENNITLVRIPYYELDKSLDTIKAVIKYDNTEVNL